MRDRNHDQYNPKYKVPAGFQGDGRVTPHISTGAAIPIIQPGTAIHECEVWMPETDELLCAVVNLLAIISLRTP
jgi:hypothetical protein